MQDEFNQVTGYLGGLGLGLTGNDMFVNGHLAVALTNHFGQAAGYYFAQTQADVIWMRLLSKVTACYHKGATGVYQCCSKGFIDRQHASSDSQIGFYIVNSRCIERFGATGNGVEYDSGGEAIGGKLPRCQIQMNLRLQKVEPLPIHPASMHEGWWVPRQNLRLVIFAQNFTAKLLAKALPEPTTTMPGLALAILSAVQELYEGCFVQLLGAKFFGFGQFAGTDVLADYQIGCVFGHAGVEGAA